MSSGRQIIRRNEACQGSSQEFRLKGQGPDEWGSWPSTGMAAGQLRWGQNEALVYKSLQRKMGEPIPEHLSADLSGRPILKAGPLAHY